MGAKKKSSSKFWLTQFAIIAVVILIAVGVILIKDLFSSSSAPKRNNKDPAAGFSEFYSNYRSSGGAPDQSLSTDFVMDVETSDTPIGDRLMEMESKAKPVSEGWEGEVRYRTFRAGTTLREALSAYAQEEGMQVIWELPQDFIIKDHFQVEGSILDTINKVASAISSNFPEKVRGYFCPNQRSLVLTTEYSNYLQQKCRPTAEE